jgi:hypothetical protein
VSGHSEHIHLDTLIRQALRAIEAWSPAPDAWSRLAARLAAHLPETTVVSDSCAGRMAAPRAPRQGRRVGASARGVRRARH